MHATTRRMPACNYCIGARSGAALVGTGLQIDVESCVHGPYRPPAPWPRTSACFRLRRYGMPSPTTFPSSSTRTAPTLGLGEVSPTPCRARSMRNEERILQSTVPIEQFQVFKYYLNISRKERLDEFLGIERQQVANFLADAHVANGQTQLARDGDDHSAFCGAVEFGEHDSSDACALVNSRACCSPFCPVVASITSKVSCGAPGMMRCAVRRIFSSSAIRFVLVCRRPAVSTIT